MSTKPEENGNKADDVESGTALIGNAEFMRDITKPVAVDSDLLSMMDKILMENEIIMFSKNSCPFCFGRFLLD